MPESVPPQTLELSELPKFGFGTPDTGPDLATERILTIGIPTYRRGPKLTRLLKWLEEELAATGLTHKVSVLVANNASPDDTLAILAAACARKRLHLEYFSNSKNLGFDGNILALYLHARSPYLWYMGDDDLPLEGAIGTILETLRNQSPDVLLMPFIQPPGSWRKEYEFPEPFRVYSEPGLAADVVMQIGKISVYLLRVMKFAPHRMEELSSFLGIDYIFQVIAFTILQSSPELKLVLMSKPTVTSDDDFCRIPWTPAPILEGYKICGHSFPRQWIPGLLENKRRACYRAAIRFLWDGQTGALIAGDRKVWDDFADNLDWRLPELARSPVTFIRLLLVKMHLGYAFRSPFLKGVTAPFKTVEKYCRSAAWLTAARCRFRQMRDDVRRRRILAK